MHPQEQANNQLLYDLLTKIVQHSNTASSDEFYKESVSHLHQIFGTDFAFMGLFLDQERTHVKTECLLVKGEPKDNFTYELKGTPCQDVFDRKIEIINENVASKYPDDKLLVNMEIESYFGAPIASKDSVYGILAIMDTKRMDPSPWVKPCLALYAKQLASFIERQEADKELELAEKVFNFSSDGIVVTDKDGYVININDATSKITQYSKSELIGKNMSILHSGLYTREDYALFWKQLTTNRRWAGELKNLSKDGQTITVHHSISTITNKDNEVEYYFSFLRDISKQKQQEEQLHSLIHYDALTGLPNRDYCLNYLEGLIKADSQKRIVFLLIDLDRFKLVNDSAGHEIGDRLLKHFSQLLSDKISNQGFVGRLGGDEFAIILDGTYGKKHVEAFIQDIVDDISKEVRIDDFSFKMSLSTGVSVYPDDTRDLQDLFKYADAAMYTAKNDEVANFAWFCQDIAKSINSRIAIEQELKRAVDKETFELHYQPIVNVSNGKIIGAEALIRWRRDDGNYFSPEEFIPVAEECSLITKIGEWVINRAFKDRTEWTSLGFDDLSIAINISGIQLYSPDLISYVSQRLQKYHISPEFVDFELTETTMMTQVEETINKVEALRKLGLKISIDDFGTGYSSLSYLKRFPVNLLKVDRSFIDGVLTDKNDQVIVDATVALAHSLNYKIVAEGVETAEQLAFLRGLGCEYYQGFFFSRPVPQDEFCSLLQTKSR